MSVAKDILFEDMEKYCSECGDPIEDHGEGECDYLTKLWHQTEEDERDGHLR